MNNFDLKKYLVENKLTKNSQVEENELENIFKLDNQNRQITFDLRKLSNSEFEEIYDSLTNNPDIYRIRTYGNGFIEVDLNELNNENKLLLLKYKDKIKIK